ncbi:MAG: ABC transporter permease [Candidatus Schekmanbacteria bacterium]|nr:MAG: ABC transporter permease [Candidatus Schekmanbacteria bacterium]
MILSKPLAFLKKDFLEQSSYKFNFITQFIGIFLSTILFYFVSKLVGTAASPYLKPYGGDYFAFVLIGIAFSSYLSVALSSFSTAIQGAQVSGTLEALLVTQTSIPTIIISSSLYSFLLTSLRVVLYLLLGAFVFGVNMDAKGIPIAILILMLTTIAFSSLGIISASFIMVLKRGDPFMWIFTNASWFLGGVYYPVDVLPSWLQKLSYFLPITYALEGMRLALLKGYSIFQLKFHILALLLFCIIMLPLSVTIFIFAVQKTKRDGSLTHY